MTLVATKIDNERGVKRRFFGAVGRVLFCAALLVACYHHIQPPLIDVIRVEAVAEENELTPLAKLQLYLQRYPHFRNTVSDALLFIEAEQLAAEGEVDRALRQMREALAQATGAFQQHIFTSYLTRLADSQAQPQPLAFFIEHAETQLGYSGKHITAIIAEHLGGRLDHRAETETPLPANLLQLMRTDPTLELSAKRYCKARTHTSQWDTLLASFPQPFKVYWHGLTSACQGNTQAALSYHHRYLRYAATTGVYPQLALTAAAGVVTLGRKLGKSRLWLSNSYSYLATLWQQHDYIDHAALNLSRTELRARKINDLLWAARYQTLHGAYAQATALAQQSLQEAQTALGAGDMARQFLQLIAEAYHILAFRVAAERKDYPQAIAWSNAALQHDLDPDWRERFLWYNGLYHYLTQEWQPAARFWQESMKLYPASVIRPRLLFWLAMTATQAKERVTERTAQEYLAELEEDFPLSYYTLFAAAPLTQRPRWYEQYRRTHLQRAVTEHKGIDLRRYHRHNKFARPLLRAEIFIAARLFDLAQVELRELEQRLARTAPHRGRDLRLYLTRLYFAAHRYTRSINLISAAAERQKSYWHELPEQLLIYFPQPYLHLFGKEAFRVNLPPELLLAVARQESAFRPEARSRAEALGLMQIIIPTARDIATANHLPTDNIEQRLFEPATSIKFGALLLRRLSTRYRDNLPATLAAYNAGEEVVDTWLQRRAHPDPRVWIELIPFGETKHYVMRVYRNYLIYRFLARDETQIAAR